MKQIRIPVVSFESKPLSPTTPKRARKLLKDNIALPKKDKLGNFYLQMVKPTGAIIPHQTILGVDPGKLYSGIGIQTPNATLWLAHLFLPFFQVRTAMKRRTSLRKSRRQRKTPQRKMRSMNRNQKKLPPSIKASRQLELRVIQELIKIYPVTQIIYELVKAKAIKSFAPVMSSQYWMIKELNKILPTETLKGWETARIRDGYFRLKKEKENKAKEIPQTHAIDGVSLAASKFVKYVPSINYNGYEWKGNCILTPAPFCIVSRPLMLRRQLHLSCPVKQGKRKRHGGTVTPYGVRKGDYVVVEKRGNVIKGYVGGYITARKAVSVLNYRWERYNAFYYISKMKIINRSTRLIVNHLPCAAID
jgi:RRXRR protein